MQPSAPIRSVLREHRFQLTLTYALFGLEMIGSLLRPYLLGTAVDGLLAGHYRGLLALSGVHLFFLAIGTVRHMYDTRTFSAIYMEYVTRLLAPPAGEEELSRRSALSTLARQVTDFLEYDVNYIAEAFYNIFGSLVLLFIYDRSVVSICLAILLPVLWLGRRYGAAAARLNRQQFDELEQQVDIIAEQNADAIAVHYRNLRAFQIRISDLEAWNFGATEFFVLIAVAGSLLVSTQDGDITIPVGSIIALYTYVLRFASGLETIPYTIQRLGALRDILRRVSESAPLARVLTIAGLSLIALSGLAHNAGAQAASWSPRLQLDNDAYNFWMAPGLRTDEQYTNGVAVSIETMRAPWWGPRYAPHTLACGDPASHNGACLSTVVSIAQDLYTPNLSRPPYSVPNWENERPYAAWLRLSGTARVVSAQTLREVEIAAGVTGAPAFGRLAQSIAHTITRPYTVVATGWETQVGFEPGLLASYRQAWLVKRANIGRQFAFDVAPYAGGTLGNILTEANAGVTTRIGYNLSHPWDPREGHAGQPWEFMLSAGGRRQYVLEDFSLDGRLFGGGRHVQRVPGVSEYEFGAGLRYARLALAYRAVTRGREYATGPAQHTFSSMILEYGKFPGH